MTRPVVRLAFVLTIVLFAAAAMLAVGCRAALPDSESPTAGPVTAAASNAEAPVRSSTATQRPPG